MKSKLYLDTSIPSAHYDYSKPIRQLITQKWFENELINYELYISVISIEEIEKLSKSEPEDAYHIAIATVNNINSLASWNFKHIVSLNPIRKIHEINKKNKYSIIEIGTLEIFGGAKYGNL